MNLKLLSKQPIHVETKHYVEENIKVAKINNASWLAIKLWNQSSNFKAFYYSKLCT